MNLLQIKKILYCLYHPSFFRSYINGVCPLFETKEIFKDIRDVDMLIDVDPIRVNLQFYFSIFFSLCKNYISFEPQKEFFKNTKKNFS